MTDQERREVWVKVYLTVLGGLVGTDICLSVDGKEKPRGSETDGMFAAQCADVALEHYEQRFAPGKEAK